MATFDGRVKCVTYGRTLLHKAARKGHVDEVRRLLSTDGIRAAATDDDGATALHDAVLGGDDHNAAEVCLRRLLYTRVRQVSRASLPGSLN